MRNPKEVFKEYRERFDRVYSRREQIYYDLLKKGVNQSGHGFFDHDLPVAQTCLLIHEDERETRKAWVAALLHSLDRFMAEEEEEKTIRELLLLTPNGEMSYHDLIDILMAVRDHDGPNRQSDSLTQIILQDADRVANVMAILIPRSGQFLPTLPVIELGHLGFAMHPESTYKTPRSVHDALIGTLEWDPEGLEANPKFTLRLPLAIELGRPHFAYLRGWLMKNKADFEALGLDPWPIE